jgi:hypothetical protein
MSLFTRKQKDPRAIQAKSLRYYSVICLVHGNQGCKCAKKKAQRRFDADGPNASPYGAGYGLHDLPGSYS